MINQQTPVNKSRVQIDNSILASLIALSQSMGQLQGEIAIIKASNLNVQQFQQDLAELHKVVVTGDLNTESFVSQIRRVRDQIKDMETRLIDTEKVVDQYLQDEKDRKSKLAIKRIDRQNIWKIIFKVITVAATGVLAWMGLK